MRASPAGGENHEIENIGLDEHLGQFAVSREHVDDPLLSRDPEDGLQGRVLRIDVNEQSFNISLRSESQSEIERDECLALTRPGTGNHDYPVGSPIRTRIALRELGHQVSLHEAELFDGSRSCRRGYGNSITGKAATIE